MGAIRHPNATFNTELIQSPEGLSNHGTCKNLNIGSGLSGKTNNRGYPAGGFTLEGKICKRFEM
jgi:hypothetical protein